jgi:hypothetical protein
MGIHWQAHQTDVTRVSLSLAIDFATACLIILANRPDELRRILADLFNFAFKNLFIKGPTRHGNVSRSLARMACLPRESG